MTTQRLCEIEDHKDGTGGNASSFPVVALNVLMLHLQGIFVKYVHAKQKKSDVDCMSMRQQYNYLLQMMLNSTAPICSY